MCIIPIWEKISHGSCAKAAFMRDPSMLASVLASMLDGVDPKLLAALRDDGSAASQGCAPPAFGGMGVRWR
jgi:hypothetical protein